MKRVLLLINFTSGTGEAVKLLPQILNGLARRGCETTVYPIGPTALPDTDEIVRERWRHFDAIMCVGGDGSLNHLVNALMKARAEIPIAFLPSGSTNDFASSLNNGRKPTVRGICRAIAAGRGGRYDVGKFNDRYFNYVAAFGAFTSVSYETPQDMKNVLGYTAYVLNMIASIPAGVVYRAHLRITHDDITEEGDYIFGAVCNTLSLGGVKTDFFAEARLDDGLFEVILIKAPDNIIEAGSIIASLSVANAADPNITLFTARSMTITADKEMTWTLDGEGSAGVKSVSFEVAEQAMTIMGYN